MREVVGGRRRVARGVGRLRRPPEHVLFDDARVPAPVRRREDDSGVRAGQPALSAFKGLIHYRNLNHIAASFLFSVQEQN